MHVPLLLAESVKLLQRLSIVTSKPHHILRERTSRTSTRRSLENQFNKIPCHWPSHIKHPHHRSFFLFQTLTLSASLFTESNFHHSPSHPLRIHISFHFPSATISPIRRLDAFLLADIAVHAKFRNSRRPKISFPGLENVVSSSLNATTDRLVQSPDAEHYSWLRTESSLKRPSSLSRVLAACKPEEHAQLATVLQRVLRLLLLLFRRQNGTISMHFKNTRVLESGIQSVTKGSITLATYGRYSSRETWNA